jgi:predicted component of type VI protein secretion system
MVVVGRHPQCDARLDSIRVSRRHCCMTPDSGELIVRDLGSTNGIRINGQRIEEGRLRVGDELSIAHIRFRLDDGHADERTLAATLGAGNAAWPGSHAGRDAAKSNGHSHHGPVAGLKHVPPPPPPVARHGTTDDNPLAAAVRGMLAPDVAERCKIQVIIQMDAEHEAAAALSGVQAGPSSDESPCPPDSRH